jgi:hypothetical protein
MSNSQVAQLLNQIASEYIAAQRGLTGLAIGATHEAINARMENIGRLHEHLHTIVGSEAHRLVVECLETLPE